MNRSADPKHGATPAAPPERGLVRRWWPHPGLSAVLFLSWLLLQGSFKPANLLWAAILGTALPLLVDRLIGPSTPLRAGGVALRLVGTVLWDIVVANLVVARLVLAPGREPRPAWVRVRHTLTDPRGVALLATIITTTPGTVSCHIDEEAGEILVHALDTSDAQAVADEILQRYAAPLKEIFG